MCIYVLNMFFTLKMMPSQRTMQPLFHDEAFLRKHYCIVGNFQLISKFSKLPSHLSLNGKSKQLYVETLKFYSFKIPF